MTASERSVSERVPSAPADSAPPQGRRLWKWVILAGVVAGGAMVAYRGLSKPKPAAPVAAVRTVKVVRGRLDQTVRIGGQTSARSYANITAPLTRGFESGLELTLLRLAAAGSFVKKGDVVAQIDAQASQDHMDDTAASVVQAGLDVKKRQGEHAVEWENLMQTVRVNKAESDKAKLEASAAEVRTVIDQELLKLTAEETQARYGQVQADLATKQAAHKAELRILEITALRQQRHLERDRVNIQRFTMRTPIDGLVVMQSGMRGRGGSPEMVQIRQGDQVFPGQLFMKIVDPGSMQVDASVNQAESSAFRVGQRARITLDGFPGLEFQGRIYSIGALAAGGWRQNYFIRSLPVKISIEGSDPRLIPDLSAAADVVLERVEDAVIVPLSAVEWREGKTAVHVKTGEGFVRREVELALKNHTHAAVRGNLEAGEEVRVE